MNSTSPTKRSLRYAARGRRDVENLPPLTDSTANVAAAMMDIADASSCNVENDNEGHLDCKPKAKKKMKSATSATSNDANDSVQTVIDLTSSPSASRPTATTSTTLYGADGEFFDDDDGVAVPSSAAGTMSQAQTASTAMTTSTTRRHSPCSSPRRPRQCELEIIDSSEGEDDDEAASVALARRLQEQNHSMTLQEDDKDDASLALALQLQQQDTLDQRQQQRRRKVHKSRAEKDRDEDAASSALARQLQDQDSMALQQQRLEQKTRDEQEASRLQKEFDQEQKLLRNAKRQQDEQEMSASVTGRAWKFVEKVLSLVLSMQQKHHTTATTAATVTSSNSKVSAIAKDDMVFLCEQLLRQQEAFRSACKPVKVDLAFHYTRPDNLSRIRTNGLLSKAEREGRNITSPHHGSTYGDGIYTSDDHSLGGCSGCYGDIGIIVARLKGTEKHITDITGDYDCIQSRSRAITVLKTSAQCLALVEFHRSVLFPAPTKATTTTAAAAAAAVAAPHALHDPAILNTVSSTASTATLPGAAHSLLACHSTQLSGPAITALYATAASAAHLPATPTPMTGVPAVNSGIIGEYRRELQKLVDETFNQKS